MFSLEECTGVAYSILLGITLGLSGEFLMSFIAAVAIPKEVFVWFEDSRTPLMLINAISQFLAFGISSIVIGGILGRLSERWFLNSAVCYMVFLLYIFGVSGTELMLQFTFHNPVIVFVLPVCLLMFSSFSASK